MTDFVTLLAKELREYKETTDARILELEKFKENYTNPSPDDKVPAPVDDKAPAPVTGKKSDTPAA